MQKKSRFPGAIGSQQGNALASLNGDGASIKTDTPIGVMKADIPQFKDRFYKLLIHTITMERATNAVPALRAMHISLMEFG
jgi:hypothetical protein